MGRTGVEPGQPRPAAGWPAAGAVAAYAAAVAAFGYALVSLYWAVGGHGLVGVPVAIEENPTNPPLN